MIAKWFGKIHLKSQAGMACVRGEGNIKNIMLIRQTARRTGPKDDLAHCFCCQKNINNIDLMMKLGYDFKQAINLLERWLSQYNSK